MKTAHLHKKSKIHAPASVLRGRRSFAAQRLQNAAAAFARHMCADTVCELESAARIFAECDRVITARWEELRAELAGDTKETP